MIINGKINQIYKLLILNLKQSVVIFVTYISIFIKICYNFLINRSLCMKKIFFVLALILGIGFSLNTAEASSAIDRQIKESKKVKKYNSVEKHSAQYDKNFLQNTELNLKDPKLITFKADSLKKVSETQWKKKIEQDLNYYKTNTVPYFKELTHKYNKTISADFFNLYLVSEKMIRANGLDYMNWRIVLVDDTADFNAATTSGNLIVINSALYDTFHNNDDALAFVIGHEIAHQVLGHLQQRAESEKKTTITHNVLLITTLGYGNVLYNPVRSRVEAKQERTREYTADILGAEFALRAGYDYNNIMAALNFMNSLPQTESWLDDHPIAEKRIKNLEESKKYFLPQWAEEGRYNYYHSYPLECKRSSDKYSIIVTANENKKDGFYKPEDTEDLLKRIGYLSYKNGDMKSAIKYLTQWSEISNSYIPHLYLSYCYEYLYKQTEKSGFLKKAVKEAKFAKLVNGKDDKNIEKQLEDLKDYISL